jgi:uncharacterized protein YfaS (alpha-2-macroglobulin family)
MIDQWVRFQKSRAVAWSNRNSASSTYQAYRLYTLALAGSADLGSMNRLREQASLEETAAWRLAAAYWHGGQRDTARTMVKRLSLPSADYRELNGSFGSALRDKAMILETLNLLGDIPQSMALLEDLSAALSSESWLSTQETAYALIAAFPFIQAAAGQEPITVEYTRGGRTEAQSFTTAGYQFDLGDLGEGTTALTVRNRSAQPVYARIITRGLPREGAESPLSNGLSLQVEYRDLGSGRVIDPDSLKPGDDMEVRVTLGNTLVRDIPEIALVHPLPASWELINYRLGEDAGDAAAYKYQDIRDDRVMTYLDLPRGARKTLSFRVNRAYGGDYFRPAIYAYAMYDESIRAQIPGGRAPGP